MLRQFLPIVGLEHSTSLESLRGILRYGFLTKPEIFAHPERKNIPFVGMDIQVTNVERQIEWEKKIGYKESNAFPGIYFTPVMESDLGQWSAPRYRKRYTIIVDPYILNRWDYHINPQDNYGKITDETYSRPTIDEFLKKYGRAGEIVFHNGIPRIFIKAVLVDEDDIEKVKNELDKIGLGEYKYLVKENTYQDKSYYETDPKILELPEYKALSSPLGADKTAVPAFCTYHGDALLGDSTVKTMVNCEITPQQIKTEICKDAEDLDRCESKLFLYVRKAGTSHHIPIYFPPLAEANLSETDKAKYNFLLSDEAYLTSKKTKTNPFASTIQSTQLTGIYGRLSILEDLLKTYIAIKKGLTQDTRELEVLLEAVQSLYGDPTENKMINTEIVPKLGSGNLETALALWAREKDNQLRTQFPEYVGLVKQFNSESARNEYLSKLAVNQNRYTGALIDRMTGLLTKAYPDKAKDLSDANSIIAKAAQALL